VINFTTVREVYAVDVEAPVGAVIKPLLIASSTGHTVV